MKLAALTIKAQDHAIKSVTIFKSCKAEIVRVFSAGQTKVEIEGLSSTIDTRSVRVSGLGDVRLSDVVCTIGADTAESLYAPDSSPELIRRLTAQKQALEKEKRIRDQEAELLVSYAKTLTGEHVTPSDMLNFLESFVERGRLNLKAVAELREKVLAIHYQIETEKEKKASKMGDVKGNVSVILEADAATTVDLKLTYIVSDVQWSPTYEPHATTENGKPSPSVTLQYRARVRQCTGEDWTNTALTLNTASSKDLFDKQIPRLRPVKLTTKGPCSSFKTYHRARGPGLFRSQREQHPQTMHPLSFVAETPPTAISHLITGKSTILSDGVEHQVSVAVLRFDMKISHVTVPRIDPRVYLQCQVKNTSDYRLLAGPLSVILDDSHVSKTSIPDVNKGDNFDCTLGDDPATKVTYSRASHVVEDKGGAFVEATHTTSYTTKITVHNEHTFAVPDLVVRDVIPTCDDKRVKVLLRKPHGLANVKEGEEVLVDKEKEDGARIMWEKAVDGKGGEKEGKFQWKGSVKAKDKLVLETQWDVTGPADVTWVESILGTSVDGSESEGSVSYSRLRNHR